jgi:hypothetical protein
MGYIDRTPVCLDRLPTCFAHLLSSLFRTSNDLKMILSLIAVAPLFYLAACDISVQAFDDSQCAGNRVGINVHSNPGAVDESSSCQAVGSFGSIQTLSLDTGFQCNIYSDTTCQSFLTTAKEVGCIPVIGNGIVCFSQQSFDDPLAGTIAKVGIGQQQIIADTGDETFNRALNNACTGDSSCDQNTKDTITFMHGRNCESGLADARGGAGLTVCDNRDQCTQTITVTGDYDNTQQRDYMKAVIAATMKQGISGFVEADSRDTIPNNQLSFANVVINDPKGANLAEVSLLLCHVKNYANQSQMSMSVAVQCTEVKEEGFTCDGPFKDALDAGLSLIPGAEAVAAGVDITCAVIGAANG